jgi:hypothetical protein
MATYIPNATQVTEPLESRTVESAALEFRTGKELAVRGVYFPAADTAGNRAELPVAASRAGRFLAFDLATGQPITGPLISAWTITQAQIASVGLVGDDIANVNTVAANISNVNFVVSNLPTVVQFNLQTTAVIERVNVQAVAPQAGTVFTASASFTLATGFAAGSIFGVINDSGSTITVTQGAGLTLRPAGSTVTGNRTLAPRAFVTVYARSTTEYYIMGGGLG